MSKISVILAAYHGEAFIGEQLKSLFAQTRPPDEIVIGDDSADNATHLAIEAVKHEYKGELRYIKNVPRLGFRQNFVNLAREATGDMIFFCDQDDVWLPEKIEFLFGCLEQDPDVQVVVCNSEMVDAELHPYHRTVQDWIVDSPPKMDEINAGRGLSPLLNQTVMFYGHNMAMKRTFLERFLQIPQDYPSHDLWLAQTGVLSGSLRYYDRVMTKFRVHTKNVTTPIVPVKKNWKERLQEVCKSSEEIFFLFCRATQLMQFAEVYPDVPNLPVLKEFYAFYAFRTALLQKKRFIRLFFILFCFRIYLRNGSGIRSMIRDWIARERVNQKSSH